VRRLLARLGVLSGVLLILLAFSPSAIADGDAKPPAPWPAALQKAHDQGDEIGISKSTGNYCDYSTDKSGDCRRAMDCGDFPAGTNACVGEGSSDPDQEHQYEVNQFHHWEQTTDHNLANFKKLDAYIKTCVIDDKKTFQGCYNEGVAKYPPPTPGVMDWVGGKVSKLASDALQEAAQALGHSVVWLLRQFADAFNSVSTIQLGKTGIGPIMGITTGLSALVATFLLLVQMGKLAVSQQGGPLVTAVTGLAKWCAILAVYVLATQTALNWSDTLSTAIINSTFAGGGSGSADATAAMQTQLGTLFSGLVGTGGGAAAGSALITGSGIAPSAVGAVIVISILCILAIGALWIEMLMRQAGIMILVATMPLALAGQMSDATKEWWPKARNATVTLILVKPVIVICFTIGFDAMAGGDGLRNVLVGLIIFIIAALAWPAIAKFMTFTTAGAGAGMASGLISSAGSSATSIFGGQQPSLAGAGSVGGGGGYTKALEGETSSQSAAAEASGGSGGGRGGFFKGRSGGSFMSQVRATVGLGLQVAAVGKDVAESGLGNMAAHGGLDSPNAGGRHVVIPPRGGGARSGGAGTPAGPAPATPESDPPVLPASTTGTSEGS
jgi:hypothetical protein